ncbi:MAG: SufB/SufD family protein, partial [Janthinobacterium lividum]
TAEYDGPGGEIEQLGLYFVDADQHLEHRLFVDHNAPRTTSNVDYRGALQGAGAHSVWVGDVLIRKVAEGITTYESNRNLVLTDGCRADSVPNLEIETGEIAGAGHASTTGRFDDEQLFYLRSRGIDEVEARRLVVHGFFADIIRRIGVPSVEDRLLAAVEEELAVNVGAPASSSRNAEDETESDTDLDAPIVAPEQVEGRDADDAGHHAFAADDDLAVIAEQQS